APADLKACMICSERSCRRERAVEGSVAVALLWGLPGLRQSPAIERDDVVDRAAPVLPLLPLRTISPPPNARQNRSFRSCLQCDPVCFRQLGYPKEPPAFRRNRPHQTIQTSQQEKIVHETWQEYLARSARSVRRRGGGGRAGIRAAAAQHHHDHGRRYRH